MKRQRVARDIRQLVAILALSCACVGTAGAGTRVQIARIESGGVEARDLTLRIATAATGDALTLDLHVGRVVVPALDVEIANLHAQCQSERKDAAWVCDGPVEARTAQGAGKARWRWHRADDAEYLQWRVGKARVRVARGTEPGLQLTAERLPLAWLEPTLNSVLNDAKVGAGVLSADMRVRDGAARGTWMLDEVQLDARAGNIGTAGIAAQGQLAFDSKAPRTLTLEGALRQGEWLVAPLYSKVGAQPVSFALDARFDADGAVTVSRWRWDDPETLSAEGSARVSADGIVQAVDVPRWRGHFPQAYDRYLQSVLGLRGLDALGTEGVVQGSFAYDASQGIRADLDLNQVGVRDQDGRFVLEGLDGAVHLTPDGAQASRIAWRAAQLYRVPVAAGQASFALGARRFALLDATAFDTLGGRVRLDALAREVDAQGLPQWSGSVAVENLAMPALCRALGWPEFGGTVTGRLPAMRGNAERLDIDGALSLQLFDGRVEIDDLQLERPFGVLPSVSASVVAENLDLGLLTGAFAFGSIEGRLDAQVLGLRMVDWSPVAFQARLRTDRDAPGKRRISQRAVNNLSSVGGGFAGVQQGLLKLFDSFPYAEIGLSCTLRNNVCAMDGLSSDGQGYTILRGSGLPHLTIQGFKRRVDWPVLVARLKEATAGRVPVVN
jgi:hypothetical protein